MIITDPEEFLEQMTSGDYHAEFPPCAKAAMLIEPAGFTISSQSATDNHYMDVHDVVDEGRAIAQSRGLAELIRERGIEAKVFPGDPETPDAIFPNNVFATTHQRFIIGHMLHPVRQKEAERKDIREYFESRGYQTVDLSKQDCIAELTGTMIIDHARNIGFCGMSGRVNEAGLEAMHEAFGLKMLFAFDLKAMEYHTNVVMMILAARVCVIYPGAFVNPIVPQAIAHVFPGRTLILSEAEKNAFAGNCIALSKDDLFMSSTGYAALKAESRAKLESWGFKIHHTPLDEIEKAGGSLRCMVAEIF
jgi:hypothetical protein